MYNVVFKKLLDIGDIIGISGVVFTTKVGEISVKVKELNCLLNPYDHYHFQKQMPLEKT